MILQDVVRFLLVYVVFLLGFASALAALTGPCLGPGQCPYSSVGSAAAALFKLTLGLGDLSGPEHSKFPVFFLVLLIIYVILTSVLLLNVLIALMNETINAVSSRNEKIWRVQRAITILDLERCLPTSWRGWLQSGTVHPGLSVGLTPSGEEDLRTCLRVKEERRWTRAAGRSHVTGIHEDPTIPQVLRPRKARGAGGLGEEPGQQRRGWTELRLGCKGRGSWSPKKQSRVQILPRRMRPWQVPGQEPSPARQRGSLGNPGSRHQRGGHRLTSGTRGAASERGPGHRWGRELV
uniref:Ion transport domain-containing protein n=1 Tax=Monodelphis domestica TaxID=13616 RepID=A0A5F8H8X3_MONDO